MTHDEKINLDAKDMALDRELAETAALSNNAYPRHPQGFRARLEERLCDVDEAQQGTSGNDESLVQPTWSRFSVAVAGLAACLAIIALGFSITFPNSSVGEMVYASSRSAEKGINPGDVLTADEGDLVSLLDNRVTLLQKKGSVVTVDKGTELELQSGEVFVHVKPNSGYFAVRTPFGGLVEVMGTSFSIASSENGVSVNTYSGKVKFSGTDGILTLEAAQRAVLASDGTILKASAGSEMAPQWAKDLMGNYQENALRTFFPSTAPRDSE